MSSSVTTTRASWGPHTHTYLHRRTPHASTRKSPPTFWIDASVSLRRSSMAYSSKTTRPHITHEGPMLVTKRTPNISLETQSKRTPLIIHEAPAFWIKGHTSAPHIHCHHGVGFDVGRFQTRGRGTPGKPGRAVICPQKKAVPLRSIKHTTHRQTHVLEQTIAPFS